ncbi:hypothetical protein BDV97DRAFT_227770 [Delphinella strobiligena]|nr:hypothetical protein BDV97DRAFT_227770 [Delphinella strobiligena]
MSVAAVASSVQSPHSFDIGYRTTQPTHMAESPSAQRKNRAPRARQGQPASHMPYHEVQSDSNLPATQIPKPKKHRQRQNDNKAASGSEGPNPRTVSKSQSQRPKQAGKNSPAATLATPAKNLAYASAAFHQSPAASSLPMPKFMSKSVPANAPNDSLQARLDHDSRKTSASPSPPAVPTPDPLAREKSPLDMFFNADRNEKAKQTVGTQPSPFVPNRTPPVGNKDLFMLELDNSDTPAAARAPRPQHAPRMVSAPDNLPLDKNQDATAAATRSLKEFLNLSSQPSAQPSPKHLALQHQPLSNGSPAQPHLPNPFVTSTPQHQSRDSAHASPYHYGNRNLSPLFQAVRTPNGAPAPVNNSPLQNRHPANPPQPFDPRAFLDQHARSASLGNHTNFSPVQPQHAPNPHYPDPRLNPSAFNPVQALQSPAMPLNYGHSPNYNRVPAQRLPSDSPVESQDVKDMEAKLRGILKLG